MSQIKTLTLSFMGKQYKWQRLFSTRLLVIYTGTYLLSTPVPDALTTQNNLHVYTTNGVYFYNIYFNQCIKKSDIGIHLYRTLSFCLPTSHHVQGLYGFVSSLSDIITING